jgi:hypothetical protein
MNRTLSLLAALALAAGLASCTKQVVCPSGQVDCAGQCVDTSSDVAHCGACATTCDARATCQAGRCDCGPGLSDCDGACVDLASDKDHCGACGIGCFGGQVCTSVGGPAVCADACGGDLTSCGGSCAHLSSDRYHCGACGTACTAGEACVAGACTALHVACFATDEVQAVAPDLATRASPRKAGDGPIALATLGGDLWSAGSLSGSLSRLPLDLAAAPTEVLLHGNDFEFLTAEAGKLVVANSGAGTVVVFDPVSGAAVDEIPVGASAAVNPHGISFAGGKAYVSLYGNSQTGDPAVGQRVAILDAAGLASCGTAVGPAHCLVSAGTVDLAAGADAGGRPFPGRSVALAGKVYVTIANLKLGGFGFFTDPAGPGRLAIIDSADDSLSFLSLGAGCGNPGGLALHGSSIWVACGAGGLVEVDLSGAAPAVGEVHPVPVGAPGNVAFCGDRGFVTDQFSGNVYAFDPVIFADSPPAATAICPRSPGASGFAWAADVLCVARP